MVSEVGFKLNFTNPITDTTGQTHNEMSLHVRDPSDAQLPKLLQVVGYMKILLAQFTNLCIVDKEKGTGSMSKSRTPNLTYQM